MDNSQNGVVEDNYIDPTDANIDVDTLIVGAGFSGIACLKALRDRGFSSVIYEATDGLGGTWRRNRYPGARFDIEVPVQYELSWPEIYKDWTWSTNFPDYLELQRYFDHIDAVLQISKSCSFRTTVVAANFHPAEGKWHTKTTDGRTAKSKHLILAVGAASKSYTPDFKNQHHFQGLVHHSASWPSEPVDVRGKKCAIVGTGASGVGIVHQWGAEAKELTVFQRTPNLALPMGRRPLTLEEQARGKPTYSKLFDARDQTFGGILFDFVNKTTFEDTPEQRETFYEDLWKSGGFRFWLATYQDMLFNPTANAEAYDFWAKKVRSRITDEKKRNILAPLEKPHYFGVKRASLEQNYYEQFNQQTVDIVDVKSDPIDCFIETGLQLTSGRQYEFDVMALATGFDILTGGLVDVDIRSIHDTTLEQDWSTTAESYLGMMISGYPNMFYLYGPNSPSLLLSGPTSAEVQSTWIADCVAKMSKEGIKFINPVEEAQKDWKKLVNAISQATLVPTTRSTYMGGAIPGKPYEQLTFLGGLPMYAAEIKKALDTLAGFDVVRN